jgi:hypothetical protein
MAGQKNRGARKHFEEDFHLGENIHRRVLPCLLEAMMNIALRIETAFADKPRISTVTLQLQVLVDWGEGLRISKSGIISSTVSLAHTFMMEE